MKLYFSKKLFLENSEPGKRKDIRKHLEELDGKEVTFRDGQHGEILTYLKDGYEYYLYPVYKKWCEENEKRQKTAVQMTLEDK